MARRRALTRIGSPFVFNPVRWYKEEWLGSRRDVWRHAQFCLIALPVALVVVAPILPLPPAQGARLADVLLLCMLYAVVALGLNVVTGYTGLLDLGIVAFAAIGAYTATILYDRPWMQFPLSFVVVLFAGGLHAALWGLIRGAPTLRLTGDYFAIVTFAFAEIVRIFIRNEAWLTGGGNGYKNFPPLNLFGGSLENGSYAGVLKTGGFWRFDHDAVWHGGTWQFYYLVLFILLVSVALVWRLSRSRVGRAWFAIKADETSAMLCGINLAAFKMNSFAISAFLAGIGGALIAFRTNTVSTNLFDFWFSIVVLACIVLGGMGSIAGVLSGTFLVIGLGEVLREQVTLGTLTLKVDDRARFVFFGVLIILTMIFRPQGLIPRRASTRLEPFDASGEASLFSIGKG
jgi:branched-chain amino acid transport system permease protein